MKKLILIFAITSLLYEANAQDAAYKSTLKTMLDVSGSNETFKAAIDQMVGIAKQSNPNVPDEFWKELTLEVTNTSLNDIVDLLAPVYAKHLDIDDLKGIIGFYKTPTGKKFASKQPLIAQESMLVGQQWGMDLGQKIANKLQEKGY